MKEFQFPEVRIIPEHPELTALFLPSPSVDDLVNRNTTATALLWVATLFYAGLPSPVTCAEFRIMSKYYLKPDITYEWWIQLMS